MENIIKKILIIMSILVLSAGCTANSGKPAGKSENDSDTQLSVEEDSEIEIDEDMDSGGF